MNFAGGPPVEVESLQRIEEHLRHLAEETDLEFAVQIVDDFRAAAPPMIADMRDALAQTDPKLAGRIAHSLRGNCASFGLIKLAAQLQALESACRQAPDSPPVSAVEPVAATYQSAEALLFTAARVVLKPRKEEQTS
jgi:HPt (histidine-containing phosphotransfer) domain-containing protein